jgi:hypothetical protein
MDGGMDGWMDGWMERHRSGYIERRESPLRSACGAPLFLSASAPGVELGFCEMVADTLHQVSS